MAKAKAKKRADGLYSVQIVVGTNANGTPKRKTFYGHTIKEVEAKKAEYQEKLRNGTLVSNEKATFGEVAAVWLIYKRGQLGEKGLRQYNHYQSIIDNQLQPLQQRKIKELKPVDLDMILAEYAQKGQAKKTLIYYKQTASQVLDYAVENDYAYRNVFAKVKIPAAPETERQPLTDEQIRLVTDSWEGHRAGPGALLMLYCGLRRGELVPLTWSDIDLSNKTVSINKSVMVSCEENNKDKFVVKPGAKTEAGSRVVDIPDCIIPALRQAKASAESMLVFPGADGGLLTNQGYKRLWESYMHYLNICAGGKDKKRIADQDGKPAFSPALQVIEPFTAHQLRHTYATLLYDAGVDTKSAQKLMGHASIEMTLKIYTHLSQRKKADSIGKLNEFLNDQRIVI